MRKSENFFKEIAENTSDIVIIADKNSDIKYCSRSVERYTGYKSEELIGISAFTLIHPDDRKRAADDFGKALLANENTLSPKAFRIVHKNGSEIYLDGLGRNLLGNPDIAGFVMNVRDVTKLKRMEEKLQMAEQRFQALTEQSSDMIVLISRDLKVTYINSAAEIFSGLKKEAILGGDMYHYLHPDDFQFVADKFSTFYHDQSSQIQRAVVRLRDGNGNWRNCEAVGTNLLRDHVVESVVVNLRDITEREQMEESLRKSEENFRHSLDHSPLAVRVSTVEGETIYANRAILDIYGYDSVEELKKTSIKERYTPESYAEWQVRRKTRLQGEFGPSEYEISIMRKDGEMRHLHVFRKEIFWNSKKQSQVVYQDITLRRQAEEKLNRTLDNLRQSIKTTIQVLGRALETKDPYTAGHQNRVSRLARAIASRQGLSREAIEGIRMAGSIHDVGKLPVPAEILSKPTKLTNLEFSLIKEHSQNGFEMLKNVESPWPLAEIVHQHHERMDGSGYPNHLNGDDILLEARIMAVADVVEAMASHRPYRPGLGIESALHEIEKNKGILYDESVVNACLSLFREQGYLLE